MFPLLLLLACTAKTDTDDSSAGVVDPCEGVTLVSTLPAPGATDAYYRGTVEWELSLPKAAEIEATVRSDLPGTLGTNATGTRFVWTWDAPLAPSTPYSITLDWCDQSSTIDFTTSDYGTPVTDPAALVGSTFQVDLGESRILSPVGLEGLLPQFFPSDILIMVTAVGDATVEMIGGTAREADDGTVGQNWCDPTIPFPTADWIDDCYFTLGPQDTTFAVAGVDVTIAGLAIDGTVGPDGTEFDGGRLSGTIDTRPLAALVGDPDDPGAMCALAANFGTECEPCPADGEPYCFTIVADSIHAPTVDVTLVEVLGQDCPDCETAPPDPGTCTG